MRLATWLLMGSIVGSAGCSDPELANRLGELETRIAEVEKAQAERGPANARAKAPEPDPNEGPAAALLKEASEAAEGMKYDDAKAKIAELKEKYPKTRAARAVARLENEIQVIGSDSGTLSVDQWFQGEGFDLNGGKATMLVFWEVWCPHCKREVPKLEEMHNKYKAQGFQMIGLTKMTRNITEEEVRGFISEKGVTYPMAKEKGNDMSERFGVRGIPAAAVVKDGKVVWRGHPAKVNDDMISQWIGS
jgi:thiol-disulfide isomerase/thioredoxin